MILGHNHPAVDGRGAATSLSSGQLFAGQNRARSGVRRAARRRAAVGGEHPDRPDRHRDGPARRPHRSGGDRPAQDAALRRPLPRLARPAVHRSRGRHTGAGRAVPLTAGQSARPPPTSCSPSGTTSIRSSSGPVAGDVACVLMEPVMCNTGLIAPAPGYLAGVKSLCAAHGALLVIDEVITGFRLGLTGAQGRLGVYGAHLDLRQGDRVGLPPRRARGQRRPARPGRSRRDQPLRHLQRRRQLARRRRGHAAPPHRHRPLSAMDA